MPLPFRPIPPALLIACAFGAGGIAPAHAEIVALPPALAAFALSPTGNEIGADDAPPVQVEDALPAADARAAVRRSQPARRCGPGAACADGGNAQTAADSHGDDGRYDFYWRIHVAGAGAAPDAERGDSAVDVAVAHGPHGMGAAIPGGRTRSPWLFVDAPASGLPRAADGFVLVADRGGTAAVQGTTSALLPEVDSQVDALAEPPAWSMLALGVSWLCVAAWRRHTRRD